MGNKKKNNKLRTLLVILVLVIFVWVFYKKSTMVPIAIDTTNSSAVESTQDVSNATSTNKKVPTISYQKALTLYKDKRIQFDKDQSACAATPNHATYKNGTTIMLDNRANETRTIKIGNTYTVKAYGFKLVKLSSSKLPVTWLVDCNEHQNVATILMQK